MLDELLEVLNKSGAHFELETTIEEIQQHGLSEQITELICDLATYAYEAGLIDGE